MYRIPIALFDYADLAEPLRQRLIENNIPAEIHSQHNLEKLWFVSKKEAGVRLEVPAAQFEQAYNLLLGWDVAERVLADAVRCPECNSFRLEYPPATQKSIIPNIVVGALAAIAHVQKEYYCHECHYTWPKPSKLPPHPRQHMAPFYFIEGVEEQRRAETEGQPT